MQKINRRSTFLLEVLHQLRKFIKLIRANWRTQNVYLTNRRPRASRFSWFCLQRSALLYHFILFTPIEFYDSRCHIVHPNIHNTKILELSKVLSALPSSFEMQNKHERRWQEEVFRVRRYLFTPIVEALNTCNGLLNAFSCWDTNIYSSCFARPLRVWNGKSIIDSARTTGGSLTIQ